MTTVEIIAIGFAIATGVLAGIEIARSNARDLLAWGLLLLAISVAIILVA